MILQYEKTMKEVNMHSSIKEVVTANAQAVQPGVSVHIPLS